MSTYHVIVQDPIYGFELDGRQYRLQEVGFPDSQTREVLISTDSICSTERDPQETFQYQAMEDHWEWKAQECFATGWDQFDNPEKLLQSVAEFLNNNHPPVMKIHRA